MNNLYDKIYNAVNKGIFEALDIDNVQSSDTSVKWKKKKIKSTFNPLEKHVKNLINSIDRDDIVFHYNIIKSEYESYGCRYTVTSWDEFDKIYKNIQRVKDYSIEWLDFGDLITIILEDHREIKVCDYTTGALFLKLNHIENHDPLIICVKQNFYLDEWRWYNEMNTDYINTNGVLTDKDAKLDMDGWNKTYNNVNIKTSSNGNYYVSSWSGISFNYGNNDFNNYPGFKYVSTLAKRLGLYDYKAYMPAAGEMSFLSGYLPIIHKIFKLYSITEFSILHDCWTSTEFNKEDAFFINMNNHSVARREKKSEYFVLPFFKKISD